MSEPAERIYALLVDANPIPDPDVLESELVKRPHLYLIDSRRDAMQTHTRPEAIVDAPAPRRRRPWIPAIAGAAVAAAVVVAAFVLTGDEPDAVPPVTQVTTEVPQPTEVPQTTEVPPPTVEPSVFGPELENVGAVLTARMNSHDPEEFLRLFADDGELSFFAQTVTPDEIRAGTVLLDVGSDYAYDRSWARTMNVQFDFSPCQVNGDRVLCDVTITSDHLAPLLPPVLRSVAIQIRDDQIVSFFGATRGESTDDVEDDFRAWTFENHPDEASRMWLAEWDNQVANTEESALLHLELGAEYVQLNS